MFNIRTDLAVEAKDIYKSKNNGEIPGVEVEENKEGDIKTTTVKVVSDVGEKMMRKPKGTYITIDMPKLTYYDGDTMDKVSKVLGKTLSEIVNIDDSMTALVVGLGNWNITPDALGPKVISKVMITRHLKQLIPDQIDEGIRPVCGIAPGVLGLTGIETGEIIKGVVEKIKPNLIICIDALASRKMDRVNSTIQIGNTGISPGSGVGNKRMEISENTLGVPVIAIGVPMVYKMQVYLKCLKGLINQGLYKRLAGRFLCQLKIQLNLVLRGHWGADMLLFFLLSLPMMN